MIKDDDIVTLELNYKQISILANCIFKNISDIGLSIDKIQNDYYDRESNKYIPLAIQDKIINKMNELKDELYDIRRVLQKVTVTK